MLKHTTKQLIESFRYRRLTYLQKPSKECRQKIAVLMWLDRQLLERNILCKTHIEALAYRKHLASLQTTERG